MSEETTPAKKAARKSVRKKTASKRAPKKDAQSESIGGEDELPLAEATDADVPETTDEQKPVSRGHVPKSGVRDARRETADEPIPGETSEKLVPDEDSESNANEGRGSKNRGRSKEKPGSSSPEQDNSDGQERRGNRSRGRGGRDRDRDRGEKREPKPRVTIDSKDLAKKAWKIFESEVTEEGLALLDDNGLRDYARSSFNAARLFLEEKERVVSRNKQSKAEKNQRKQPEKEDDE